VSRIPLHAGEGKFGRRGASTVEVAIIAPVVFLLILGLVEISRGLMVINLLTNAAQRGCRVGIIEGKTNSDVTTAVNNALAAEGVSGDSVSIQVNDGSADVANAQPGDEVTVIVTVPASKVSWVPKIQYLTGTISGQYTLRRE
jgi:Flp pilus assembly protein TadG